MERRSIPLTSDPKLTRILAWQNSHTGAVQVGGLDFSMHSADAFTNGSSTGGRTYISIAPGEKIVQNGFVNQVKMWVSQIGDVGGWRFVVYRPNGSNYDFVGASEAVTPAGTGEQTFNLATPIPCQIGDNFGVWIPKETTTANRIGIDLKSGFSYIRWLAGFQNGANLNFNNAITDYSLSLAAFMTAGRLPYLVVVGDSVAAGHHVGSFWNSNYDGGPSGTFTSEIMHQLRSIVHPAFLYWNRGKGGQTFIFVVATSIVAAHAFTPHSILVHCGVNDVSTGRSWAQVEADLNSIKAAITTEQLLIDEITPWTAGSNTQAATIRTFNANFATWCAANGATLVRCHDEMGQIRAATGQLDDLKTAYDQDGLHYKQPGVDQMAVIWRRYL